MRDSTLLKNKSYIIYLIFALLIMLTIHRVNISNSSKSNFELYETIPYQSYIEVLPIQINGDDDFDTKAGLFGWLGSGDFGNPYIIKNLNISSSYTTKALVNISNTETYFTLEDCLLVGGASGVQFYNVTHAVLENNTIFDAVGPGVFIMLSSNNTVYNNTIYDSDIGIYLFSSHDTYIDNNTIYSNNNDGLLCDNLGNNIISNNIVHSNNLNGMRFRDALNNTIFDNKIYENLQNGIYFGASNESKIFNNTIFKNVNGLEFAVSGSCEITDNLIHDNTALGILFSNSGKTSIIRNTFYNQIWYALRILSGIDYNVFLNNFIDNIPEPGSQITVGGSNSSISYNYWSDWIMPDENLDDIVDYPYAIDEGNIYDYYPRTKAYAYGKIHILTKPQVYYPNNGVISEITKLKWGIASDTMGHLIKYTLYFTTDNKNWFLIADNILNTSYEWDTTLLPDNYTYMIKVVANCSVGIVREDISDNTFVIGNSPHIVSAPHIMQPLGGTITEFPVLIEWTPSTDSWGFPVNYSVLYSNDGGWQWNTIIENIGETQCYWDISANEEGNYLIKIVVNSLGGIYNETISEQLIIPKERIGVGFLPYYIFSVIVIIILIFRVKRKKNLHS
ncbi:MAG: nitrous oxide reductase family maturation protein NosD [Candidatus Thorarchaeota archaeon]